MVLFFGGILCKMSFWAKAPGIKTLQIPISGGPVQTTWNRIKDNAGAIAATCMVVGLLAGFFQYSINSIHRRIDDLRTDINQRLNDQNAHISQRFNDQDRLINQRFNDQERLINQRFDAVNQRFDTIDQRLEHLETDVSELHRLNERVSRTEGQIDSILQQMQTADVPSP